MYCSTSKKVLLMLCCGLPSVSMPTQLGITGKTGETTGELIAGIRVEIKGII